MAFRPTGNLTLLHSLAGGSIAGRVDKTKMGPKQLLEVFISATFRRAPLANALVQVAQKSLVPYSLNPSDGINWWTLYISKLYSPKILLAVHLMAHQWQLVNVWHPNSP